MKPASAKEKGRRLQRWVAATMLKIAGALLREDDIQWTSMGASGEDIRFSPLARDVYPVSVECKNQERMNIWSAWRQTKANAGDYEPVLFIKRNNHEVLGVVRAEHLLELQVERYNNRDGES